MVEREFVTQAILAAVICVVTIGLLMLSGIGAYALWRGICG